jgi:propanol-preferring alcohol dehydrogenase
MSGVGQVDRAPILPKTMQAAVLEAAGTPLRIRDVPVPVVARGQILVRIDTCGICHTDLHVLKSGGNPDPRTPDPLILGHEGVGTIVQVAEGAVKWCIGDRVGVAWLHDTCGHCPECLGGMESFCQIQRAHGYDVNGAFAAYVATDARFAVRIPASADPVSTAPLMCAGLTAYGAVKTARIGVGTRCAIFGCGGLGLFAVQIAARAGASVVALDRALELGARHAMLVDEHTAQRLQELGGMHAIINFAPTTATWPAIIGGIRPLGRIVAAAMVAKEVPISQEWLTRLGVTITGTSVGTRLQMEELMRMHAEDPFVSDTRTIPLSEINEGLKALERGEVSGRLVLDLRDGSDGPKAN